MKSTLDNYMNELDAFLTEASTVKFNNKETLRGQGFDRKVKEDGTESGSELGGEFSFTPEAKPKQENPQPAASPEDNQGQIEAGENQETNKAPNNNGQNGDKAEGEPAPETAPETAPAPQQPNANNGLKKKYMKMLKVVTTIQKEVNQLEKASGKTIDELAEIASQSSQQSSEQQQ
jgi:hypothetical protein